MRFLILILILPLFFACNGGQKDTKTYPVYYIQIYVKEGSQLERTLGKEFGELKELSNEFVINDSSAYVFAWGMTEQIRNSNTNESDLFSSVNEFKLYDWQMNEITKSVMFQGIENYPNPIK